MNREQLVARAHQVLPAGTFGNVSFDTVIREGHGAHVWDEAGNEYIDYLLGSGPMLIGHGHPQVTAAVRAQLANGTTFFANNRHGIMLAAQIVDAIDCAEQVRFVCTGSEADLYAMRAARAFTGRDKILKFEGGYHGMSDYSLMSLAPQRPGNFPQPVPDSAGIPRRVADDILVAPYNDADTLASLVAEHRDSLAAVIVEPFQRIIGPEPGFLQALRDITTRHGVVLIFDEVVTGFRLAYGGAQAYYGVTPDLCTLGKVIGGGFALAAIAGRADIMAHFDKSKVGADGFLVQIGTLSGNPVAAAAGLATMEVLREEGAYERLFETGRTLMTGLRERLQAAGITATVIGEPPLFEVVFAEGPIRNYRDVLRGDAPKLARFNTLLRERGIFKGDSKYYVSLAHTQADIDQTFAAWEGAIEVLRNEA
ncbi:MAG: aspartate aminotransferase family protein [Gammaproteobacteria bacterium]